MNKHLRAKFARLIRRRSHDLQVAALCLEPSNGKVLLITSRDTGRWVVPKGWPMLDRSLAEAAAQEAWEEAGVRGEVSTEELGRFHYDKQQSRNKAVPVEVIVFPLHVSELANKFPEKDERRRKWFDPKDAAKLVAEPGLQALLRDLPKALPGLSNA